MLSTIKPQYSVEMFPRQTQQENLMRLPTIKLIGACSLLLLVSCSDSSTEEPIAENQPEVSMSSVEQIDNDTGPEQESGPDTSNDSNPDTSSETESGPDTSSDSNPDTSSEPESGPDTSNDTNPDTSSDPESGADTSNDTNPDTSSEQESGPDTSSNSFSRRVSSLEFGDRFDILWQHFYSYDDTGKLVTVTRQHTSEFLSDDILTYQYNVDGLLTAISTDISGDGTVDQLITFEYDEQGRVVSMADDIINTGELVDYTYYSYDNEGRLAGYDEYVYYNNGALSHRGTYLYDENNVRTGVNLDFLDGGSITTFSYIYNAAGELETKQVGSTSSEYYLFEDGIEIRIEIRKVE